MKFVIEPHIFEQNPHFKVGVCVIKGFDNSRRVSAVQSLLRGISAQRGKQFAELDIEEEPMVKSWYDAYGRFGINPRENTPSIASLLKRAQNGKEIPSINALVDLYNYYSLKFLLPIGGDDLDWLCGDLRLGYTKGGEPFRPMGSIEIEEAAEGEVAYMDNGGITCRYWNYREGERTKFTPRTVNAALFVEDMSNISLDRFGAILREIQLGVDKYIGGDVQIYILNRDKNTVDFGIKGRTTANDGKIPAQEKVAFKLKASKQQKNRETHSPALPQESGELIKSRLKVLIEIAAKKAFPECTTFEAKIEYPSSAEHGDYATNSAMQLAGELGLPPREIAAKIIEQMPKDDLVEHLEMAGPGFINIWIADEYLQEEITRILENDDQYGFTDAGTGKNIIFEYSSPNIAKPLGVHHLLSTVIGQSLSNLYHALGYHCINLNYPGDWGTQFGKLLYAYKQWGNKKTIEKDPINEMLKLYVRFHDEAEKTPELEDKARREFRMLEEGDAENRELWRWFVEESMKEIDRAYERLKGIHFDHIIGESFYEDKMEEILQEGKEKGVFEKGEEGAYIAQFDDPNIPPLVIQKKDGATLYATRDLAALKHRIKEWRPMRVVYVVDMAQMLHFQQIFGIASRFAWYHGEGDHVWFGRMRMRDKKMSTRKGNIILLQEVLDEAVTRAQKIIAEKNPELQNRAEVAEIVGIGAVKYNILSQNRTTEIVFDWDKMLSFEGNSAPYLQYTYARAQSILRRAHEAQEVENAPKEPVNVDEIIRNVESFLPKFAEYIALAARDYKPNVLANYLFELAQRFNTFYSSVPVLKASTPKREKRLRIVQAVSVVLRNGLNILGIGIVDEM